MAGRLRGAGGASRGSDLRYNLEISLTEAYAGKTAQVRVPSSVQKFNRERGMHPTQKPVKLYDWLLANYAKPGDTILDTHLGSQSSRIAAWDLGFDFTGFELDEDYFKAGCERFEIHKAQAKLFDAPVLETVEQESLF